MLNASYVAFAALTPSEGARTVIFGKVLYIPISYIPIPVGPSGPMCTPPWDPTNLRFAKLIHAILV